LPEEAGAPVFLLFLFPVAFLFAFTFPVSLSERPDPESPLT
jgi:hypothetical protein